MKTTVYAEVTAQILAELEAGAAPWVKPWSGKSFVANMPHNAATGRAYSGINIVLLWMAQEAAGYSSSRWLTFKQAQAVGGMVRKGEKGRKIVFVSAINREEDNGAGETEAKRIPFLKQFTVFNVDQVDGLPAKMLEAAPAPVNQGDREELAEAFLAATGARIQEGTGAAYYTPGADQISLPAFAAFKDADHYYATAFHELAHWTGHKRRLDRDFSGRFGTQAYAAEELVAELTAAFLCAEFGFNGDLRHAGYIESWVKLLKHDDRAFFTAASKAQKAADYLRELAIAAEPAAELVEAAPLEAVAAEPIAARAVDLTAIGEQYVIDGCGRAKDRGAAQLSLWG